MTALSNTQKKKQQRNYIRAGIVDIDVILPLIRDHSIKSVILHGHKVNVTSLRLINFGKSTVCSGCGLQATHFAVESNGNWHLNLYAAREDKRDMLFTHDHTLARSLGGSDDEENTTTMCAGCNFSKSKVEFVEYCQQRGLPPPGSGKSARKQAIEDARQRTMNPTLVAVGTTIIKKSGRKFKNDTYEATVMGLCTSLFDPHHRVAYVLEDESIICAYQVVAK